LHAFQKKTRKTSYADIELAGGRRNKGVGSLFLAISVN